MKKTKLFVVLSMMFGLSACSALTTTSTTTTTATPEFETVQINTVEDLQNLQANQNAELMADLDLSGIEWTPLCSYEEPYLGEFNGNNHTISNLTITLSNDDYNGLFAQVVGDVHDLNLTNIDIDYTTSFLTYAGGLAGVVQGDITNVNVDGSISIVNSSSSTFAGGLAGMAEVYLSSTTTAETFEKKAISDVTSDMTIFVNTQFFAYVGGLVGKSYNYELIGNTVSSDLTVTADIYRAYVGGLAGHHYGGILINQDVSSTDLFVMENVVFSTITVTSSGTHASIGGLFGYSQYGIVYDNFSMTSIQASGMSLYIGSLLGEDWYGEVYRSVGVADFNITEEDGQMLFLSSVTGYQSTSKQITESYYNVIANTEYSIEDGTEVTLTELTTSDFFTSIGWDETGIDVSSITSQIPA